MNYLNGAMNKKNLFWYLNNDDLKKFHLRYKSL